MTHDSCCIMSGITLNGDRTEVNMSIKVSIKSVYGNKTIYPECKQAVCFSVLLGQKTLTRRDIDIIKQMGYQAVKFYSNGFFRNRKSPEIEVIQPVRSL